MMYYCNFVVKGCKEEEVKDYNYKKELDYYKIRNNCDSNEFREILDKFKEYKLMVFYAPEYDESFYIGFSDNNSTELDEQIVLCPFDFHNEEWFINKYYPTDKFENKQIDEQTGILIKTKYENPAQKWWDNTSKLNDSIDRSKIQVEELEEYDDINEMWTYSGDDGYNPFGDHDEEDMQEIIDVLIEMARPLTIIEIQNNSYNLDALSNQEMVKLLNKLIEKNKINKKIDNHKAYYDLNFDNI